MSTGPLTAARCQYPLRTCNATAKAGFHIPGHEVYHHPFQPAAIAPSVDAIAAALHGACVEHRERQQREGWGNITHHGTDAHREDAERVRALWVIADARALLHHPHGGVPMTGERPTDHEAMRKARGWPTPNHMRRAADALDVLTTPRYGDVLRWVADLCDDALANGLESEAGHSLIATPVDAERVRALWSVAQDRQENVSDARGATEAPGGLSSDTDPDYGRPGASGEGEP